MRHSQNKSILSSGLSVHEEVLKLITLTPIYRLRCLLSRENLNSTFSASYISMAITFDLLDRFQENKAQTMNNVLKSNTKWLCPHGNRDLLNHKFRKIPVWLSSFKLCG